MRVERQELLDAATPRPWCLYTYTVDGAEYEEVRDADEEAIVVLGEGCFFSEMETANLQLIVAAVNEHAALLACETGLRALVGLLRPDNRHALHARNALETLDRIREAQT